MLIMDVKEAVKKAAAYVIGLESMSAGGTKPVKAEALLRDIRFAVEGTHFDEKKDEWDIEVGFTRKWDQATASPLMGLAGNVKDNRTYKHVLISDKTGEVVFYG